MKFIPNYSLLKYLSVSILIFIILTGCENNIEVIKSLTFKEKPIVSAENIEILYSDSGKVKIKVNAPILNKYTSTEKPYVEFPEGLTLTSYDTSFNIESIIKSRYAIYYEKEKLWQANTDVEAKNIKKNEQLNTEELFWDQKNHKIYSQKYTKIINKDGVFFGDNGFTANESLSKWKLIGIKGKVNIKDQETNATENP